MWELFKHHPVAGLFNTIGQPVLTRSQMLAVIMLTVVIALVTFYVKLPIP